MKRSILFFCLFVTSIVLGNGKEGYYRFPSIYENKIVFTAEGDLWIVDSKGGVAQRLTTHHSMETHAEFSPDGFLISFSAQYEGPTEIYTIPVSGGLPTRWTYEGGTATVIGWTPKGNILYSTRKYSTLPNTQLVEINIKNSQKNLIPLNQASDGCYEPDEKDLFFTRLPFQGSYTKRYVGGTAQNLWKYTTGSAEAIPITTDYPGTSKNPLVWQDRVYFVSDRDGTMNIWSIKFDGSDVRQHTRHSGWDVSNASLHNGRIVYQRVCDLFLYDISKNTDQKINITLASDFEHMRDRWVKEPMDYLTSAFFSPDGDRIALTARGQVFVAPVKQGRLVQATRKEGVRYRFGKFMPDGKNLIVLSDESGEVEYWKIPANGVGDGEALTSDGDVLRYKGVPSPDGKWIAYRDKDYQLWIFSMMNKKTKKIATSETSNYSDLFWSPDSRYLTFVAPAENHFAQIMLYDNSENKFTTLTSDRVDSYNPTWSPDGKWIYFLSDRVFNSVVRSPWGPRQPEPYFDKTTKIYMIALNSEGRFPFSPNDELYPEKKVPEKNSETDQSNKVIIDFSGIQKRVFELPLPVGTYSNLSVNKTALFWTERNAPTGRTRNLMGLEIKNDNIKPEKIVEGVRSYEMSLNGKKLLVRKSNNFFVVDAKAKTASNLNDHKVDLSKWTFSINPREEWRQMFIESWRLERDYFYDPEMHGVDYQGLLDRHLPLVNRVTDRDELGDLISHLVGELSALHIFVRGGDKRQGDDKIQLASLGAKLVRDDKENGYRIDYIYKSEPDYVDQLSPLVNPELNIQEGDIITAINGVKTLSVADPGILLKNQIGQQVLLSIKSAKTKQNYNAVVKPISQSAESNLRYSDWEYSRRLCVEDLGDGELGYVHLRAMGGGNYTEWVRNFYPVFNRKGLIIDVRHNRGGNIDSWILEKLMRKAWFYWKDRVGKPTWNMQYAFRGHMVILCNERTASDGEAITEGFRRLGLGKVIGTRTWGGEIWLSGNNYLVDRGVATAAESGVYGPEGEWLIEGYGVVPDMEVDNLPHGTFMGNDVQLEAAINYLQEKIEKEPVDVPDHPKYPDKSIKYKNK